MTATSTFERFIADWLDDDGPDDVPDRVVEAAVVQARHVRQRPALLTTTWWTFPGGGGPRPRRIVDRVPAIQVARPQLRLAWVAALLAVLVVLGGLVAAGMRPNELPSLLACAPGSTQNRTDAAGDERPRAEVFWAIWNAGDGHSVLAATGDGTWRFDVCSNTWSRLAPAGPWPEEGRPAMAYDADTDVVVAITAREGQPRMWSLDPDAPTWVAMPVAPGAPASLTHPRIVYDPITGLVLVVDGAGVWTYDVATNVWQQLAVTGPTPPPFAEGYVLVTYDTSVDRVVLYMVTEPVVAGAQTWEFDIRAATWARTAAETPIVNLGYFAFDHIAYDDANGRTLIFGDATVVAYDATADTWSFAYGAPWTFDALPYGPLARLTNAVAFDSLNRRLIVFGGSYRASSKGGWNPADDVLAFDAATGAWLRLLDSHRGPKMTSDVFGPGG